MLQTADTTIYQFRLKTLTGDYTTLAPYQGKCLLIVNTASACCFTAQYAALEQLYRDYKTQGLVVLGFPCNQFGQQEPGPDSAIKQFCATRFAVSFPMFAKIAVNGVNADPLYQYLKNERSGFLGSKAIKWNFTKFLVNQQGQVVKRFAPWLPPAFIGRFAIRKLINII